MNKYNTYEEWFPLRLAKLRLQKGVSARDMSLSIGQNPGYINNIETGKAFPSMTGFFYICDYLGVTPAEFFDTGAAHPLRRRAVEERLEQLTDKQWEVVLAVIRGMQD